MFASKPRNLARRNEHTYEIASTFFLYLNYTTEYIPLFRRSFLIVLLVDSRIAIYISHSRIVFWGEFYLELIHEINTLDGALYFHHTQYLFLYFKLWNYILCLDSSRHTKFNDTI